MSTWYIENDVNELTFGYAIKSILFDDQSEYQKVQVFDTKAYGKMMVIDDFVMITQQDEFVYHELLAHVPMCHHPNPRNILVIGGGDGGSVRELLKHQSVEAITLCEIDKMVVDASRKYFPQVACGFDDPRVTIRIGDGIEYMRQCQNKYDVILVDSTDPIGPGEGLFSGDFYKSVAVSLRKGGIVAAQTESPWADAKMLLRINNNLKSAFSHVLPYIGPVPTYPRGLWSWTLASQHQVIYQPASFDNFSSSLSYLTPDHMQSIFAIPPFFAKKLYCGSNSETT